MGLQRSLPPWIQRCNCNGNMESTLRWRRFCWNCTAKWYAGWVCGRIDSNGCIRHVGRHIVTSHLLHGKLWINGSCASSENSKEVFKLKISKNVSTHPIFQTGQARLWVGHVRWDSSSLLISLNYITILQKRNPLKAGSFEGQANTPASQLTTCTEFDPINMHLPMYSLA